MRASTRTGQGKHRALLDACDKQGGSTSSPVHHPTLTNTSRQTSGTRAEKRAAEVRSIFSYRHARRIDLLAALLPSTDRVAASPILDHGVHWGRMATSEK